MISVLEICGNGFRSLFVFSSMILGSIAKFINLNDLVTPNILSRLFQLFG